MPQGPLGIDRPLVKTRLKYDAHAIVPDSVDRENPKASDVLDKRVNTPQSKLIEYVMGEVGDVILAVNRLAHPSRYRVISTETRTPEDSSIVPSGHTEHIWTYVIIGKGAGSARDTSTDSSSMWKLHEVLIKGNNKPIETASKIRQFDAGPIEISRVSISTD